MHSESTQQNNNEIYPQQGTRITVPGIYKTINGYHKTTKPLQNVHVNIYGYTKQKYTIMFPRD